VTCAFLIIESQISLRACLRSIASTPHSETGPVFGQSGRLANGQAQLPGTVNGLEGAHSVLKDFRAYQVSVMFYRQCEEVKCAKHLRDQLLRASSSIALNLSEGSAQSTTANRLRFYHMSLGSVRECQTILDLAQITKDALILQTVDQLAALVYKLCKSQHS
jgi:four helix bundle protein